MLYSGPAFSAQALGDGLVELKFDLAGDSVNKLTQAALKDQSLSGFVGNFVAHVKADGRAPESLDGGSVVVCTGFQEFDAAKVARYGYGRLPNVVTSLEFEKMLTEGRLLTAAGRVPQYVAMIHCVGSRSEEHHPYCSRVCCATALKFGHQIKSAIPECYVYDLYIDMHAFGKGCEDFYRRSAEMKTLFLMYEKGHPPEIVAAEPDDGCELLIRIHETLSWRKEGLPWEQL